MIPTIAVTVIIDAGPVAGQAVVASLIFLEVPEIGLTSYSTLRIVNAIAQVPHSVILINPRNVCIVATRHYSYLLGSGGSNNGLFTTSNGQEYTIITIIGHLNGEQVLLTGLKYEVIGAAVYLTIVRSNPNPVIGSGIGDAVVINASGNQDADAVIENDVLGIH